MEERWARDILRTLSAGWMTRRGGMMLAELPSAVRRHVAAFLVCNVDFEWEDVTGVVHVLGSVKTRI